MSKLLPTRATRLLTSSLRPCLSSLPQPPTQPLATAPHSASHSRQQVRHATLIKRPQRPYMFTQLVQLSDGSTFTIRTTSPHAVYRSAKDSRNHARWQPSDRSLRNLEVDEAGKLAAFRGKFGRGWDAAVVRDPADEEPPVDFAAEGAAQQQKKGVTNKEPTEQPLDLTGLLGDYAKAAGMDAMSGLSAKEEAKASKKGKKGKK